MDPSARLRITANTRLERSMLRTFISNPNLGGFGGESSHHHHHHPAAAATPDAFCQIIKELVDNAVDACTVDTAADAVAAASNNDADNDGAAPPAAAPRTTKRVRVVIERYQDKRQQQHRANRR